MEASIITAGLSNRFPRLMACFMMCVPEYLVFSHVVVEEGLSSPASQLPTSLLLHGATESVLRRIKFGRL